MDLISSRDVEFIHLENRRQLRLWIIWTIVSDANCEVHKPQSIIQLGLYEQEEDLY